jgi:hypothetical protein
MLTTYHHPVPLSRNLGTLTSWNPVGLSRPVTGLLHLLPVFSFGESEKFILCGGPPIAQFPWMVATFTVALGFLS